MQSPSLVRARTAELLSVAQQLADKSILVMGQVRAEQLRRWSDPVSRFCAPIAGGTERPSEHNIRQQIRARLASGQLKATDGMIVMARAGDGTCSACELEIEPSEASTLGYRYRAGEYQGFHAGCATLWEQECRRWAHLGEERVMSAGDHPSPKDRSQPRPD